MIYDSYSREMQHDPYPTYRHFRDEEPCHYNPKMDFYALFRFEDVWEASLDWQGCAETTAKLIGNALVYLSREPSLRQRIRDEPQLIPHAIEELLRFDAPSQSQGRTAGRTLGMHGVTIPEGARVALVTGAAARKATTCRWPIRPTALGESAGVLSGEIVSLVPLGPVLVVEVRREFCGLSGDALESGSIEKSMGLSKTGRFRAVQSYAISVRRFSQNGSRQGATRSLGSMLPGPISLSISSCRW